MTLLPPPAPALNVPHHLPVYLLTPLTLLPTCLRLQSSLVKSKTRLVRWRRRWKIRTSMVSPSLMLLQLLFSLISSQQPRYTREVTPPISSPIPLFTWSFPSDQFSDTSLHMKFPLWSVLRYLSSHEVSPLISSQIPLFTWCFPSDQFSDTSLHMMFPLWSVLRYLSSHDVPPLCISEMPS